MAECAKEPEVSSEKGASKAAPVQEIPAEAATPLPSNRMRELKHLLDALAALATEHRNTRVDMKDLILKSQNLANNLCETQHMDNSTQTTTETDRKIQELQDQMKSCNLPEDILELCRKPWPAQVYLKTEITKKSILNQTDKTRIILLQKGEIATNKFKSLREQTPALNRINQEPPDYITEITSTEVLNGQDENTRRLAIFQLDSTSNHAIETQIVEAVMEMRKRLISATGDVKTLAISTTLLPAHAIRKIIECVFQETDFIATVCAHQEDGPNQNHRRSEPNRAEQTKLEQLIINPGEMTYANLVKTMRENVQPSELGVKIITAKRNLSGEMVLAVKGKTADTAALKAAIQDKIPDARTTYKQRMATVHIYNLEEEVTMAEILEGIQKSTPEHMRSSVTVTSVRPSYQNTTNATAKMPEEAARLLASQRGIQIGLVFAQVKIREEKARCHRCWEEGHRSFQCKGVDRTKQCFLCKKEGHKKFQCPKLNQNGHTKAD